MHQVLGQLFAIILHKGDPAPQLRIACQVDQVLQQPFCGVVAGWALPAKMI
jgi:hypothetical protein